MTQVLIVGAGPTGASLAYLLARRGISVKLVEASRNFHRVFRGEGLMPSGLDALDQMGLSPLLAQVPQRPLAAWEFWVNRRLVFRVDEPFTANTQPCTLVSQPAFLSALIAETSHRYPADFTFIQNASVQDLLWRDGRVAGVKLGDGRSLVADLVIGADGRNSVVRQRANLDFAAQAHQFDILWFKLADFKAPDSTRLKPEFESKDIFHVILQGQDAFAVFRGAEGKLQVAWTLSPSSTDWQKIDWPVRLATASPPWLAPHFHGAADTLERPVLLSVGVGRCPRWSVPGSLLLGDAAHPMSPIRAQGINMALRDVIVAANHLVPLLSQSAANYAAHYPAIDAALAQIQAEREPEIIRAQQLQAEEAAQGERLMRSAPLRWVASHLPIALRQRVRQSWLDRQQALRQGVTAVKLRT